MSYLITFFIDDDALKLLEDWAYDYSDLVIRFCDDITPKFKKARIIIQTNGKEAVDLRYDVSLDKIAFLYVPSTGKEQIRFTVKNDQRCEAHYKISSRFEKIATYYINISYVFLRLNTFLLYGEYSSAAKRAMKKVNFFEFKEDTFFTLVCKKKRVVLDTCKIKPDGENFIKE